MDASRNLLILMSARSLRAFADGYVAVLLPAYLLALGYGTFEVGLLAPSRCSARPPRRSRSGAGAIASSFAAC